MTGKIYISSTVSLTNTENVRGKLYWDLFFKSIISLVLLADNNNLADFLLPLNFQKRNKLVTIIN